MMMPYMPTKLRLPAVFCCLCVVLAAVVVRPYLEMGVTDDWSYTRTAQLLAQTGHVLYNGWGAPILGWQLLPALLCIKLFGFSFTAVRLSMLPVAILTTFVFERALVRSGVNEWNAVLATLTLVLSPLFFPLSLSFMTDVPGFFAILVCFYACLRAVQTENDRVAIGWICFAIVCNAIGGTARQIAWLGTLVMVPSTLWLLRRRRHMLAVGTPVLLAGIAFIFGTIHWFNAQPYDMPESLLPPTFGWAEFGGLLLHVLNAVLETPLFLLPVLLAFTPAIWRNGRRTAWISIVGLLVIALGLAFGLHLHTLGILEPYIRYQPVSKNGVMDASPLVGDRPTVLSNPTCLVITMVVFTATLGFLLTYFIGRRKRDTEELLPFGLAYFLLLLPRATQGEMVDRYLIVPLTLLLIAICRVYQQRVQRRLPTGSVIVLGIVTCYSIAATHDAFAMYRARLAAADELCSAGVPRTAIEGGFDYNGWTQIEATGHINNPVVVVPPGAYHHIEPRDGSGDCAVTMYDFFPAIVPEYALSFDPDECAGPAGFAPVPYTNWIGPRHAAIYVVKYGRAEVKDGAAEPKQ
jgi:hypothetical protein